MILYVTCTREFSLGGPDSQIIRNTPPPRCSPDDWGTAVSNITSTAKILHAIVLSLFFLYFVYWSSRLPNAGTILPKFPAPHKRLSRSGLEEMH
jgi:hypothetical protein